MTQVTYDARKQFTGRHQAGNELSRLELQYLERAEAVYQQAVVKRDSVKRTKLKVNNDAREYLARPNSEKDISFVHSIKILKS